MKCQWKPLPIATNPWPLYRCERCRRVVEIRDDSDPEAAFARLPDCPGVVEGWPVDGKETANSPTGSAAPAAPASPPGKPDSSGTGGEARFADKAVRYATAVARWIAAGSPARTDDDVERIYETLCRPCEYFNPQRQGCKVCGCRLGKSKNALVNKIRMATEHCPRQKW